MAEIIKVFIGSFNLPFLWYNSSHKVDKKRFYIFEKYFKHFFDIGFSIFFIILLLPVFFIIGLAVKISSKEPIIYTQERIGQYGKPFIITKFRSMIVDAEKNGPELSSENDVRVTRLGRFLRKTKLDEILQVFNVLKGDMSLVGPRPERKFYIEQILIKNPNFKQIFEVKPGITSLGQIKYGYAQSLDQMLKRLEYDLYYLKNKSIFLDIKILIQTAFILLQPKR